MLPSVRRRLRVALHIPPPFVDGPLQAISRRAESAAFPCPLERCSLPIGLAFVRWNPFVETARQIAAGTVDHVRDSVLGRYYEAVRPADASEAYVGFGRAPALLRQYPPVAAFCVPWERLGPAEMVTKVERWVREDHRRHGVGDIGLADGFKYFGPVARRVAEVEFDRLRTLVASIGTHGYQRRHGDVWVEVLRRGDEYLFLSSGGGMHRTAVAAALGFETIPAKPVRRLVDVDQAAEWPNVRSGLWSVEQASHLFHHLFDFDYRAWASATGVLDGPQPVEATPLPEARIGTR